MTGVTGVTGVTVMMRRIKLCTLHFQLSTLHFPLCVITPLYASPARTHRLFDH